MRKECNNNSEGLIEKVDCVMRRKDNRCSKRNGEVKEGLVNQQVVLR